MAKVERKAALDTCALSFYQQGCISDATPEAARLAAKIEYYMQGVREDNGQVFLPALCLGEYLSQFDDVRRATVRDEIEANFIIVEYGVDAALKFAQMRFDKEAFDAARKNTGRPTPCIKVDSLIAATVCAYEATEILTDNTRDFTSLTRGALKVVPINNLPDPPVPRPTLFEN